MSVPVYNVQTPAGSSLASESYDCPHCGRRQVINAQVADFRGVEVEVRQCLSCTEVQVLLQHRWHSGQFPLINRGSELTLYPGVRRRPPKPFEHAPDDTLRAYQDACLLSVIHVGAAGAYARRALELILEQQGYDKPSLAQSIEQAGKETDPDKKLPRRLLLKLDYIKEIGNFAVHIRRDGELAIVEIEIDEVEACLETIEELISNLYEEPAKSYLETMALNAKLKAAGKKQIALPARPVGLPAETASAQ